MHISIMCLLPPAFTFNQITSHPIQVQSELAPLDIGELMAQDEESYQLWVRTMHSVCE